MIKKVKVEDLIPGNFVHDFNCDWQGRNIFIESTLINDTKVVDILRSWDIREVYIDTERGIDIKEKVTKTHRDPLKSGELPSVREKLPLHVNPAPPEVPLAVEVKEANRLRNDAANVYQHTLRMLEQGKSPDIDLTYELARRMRKSISRNRDALLLLTRIRKKDEYTLFHSISVSSLVLDMCKFKGIHEKESLDLAVGALFHDIGKTKIPDRILNKPDRLTNKEFLEMKKHSEYSIDLLQGAKRLPFECYDIALHHHEKIDGTGYPHNLQGDEISFSAQLTAICDVFDAITSSRCYKEGLGTVTGLREIYESSGSHFNKDLASEFIRCIGVYPAGACVKVENGHIGVVIGSTENLLKPVIKVFYDGTKEEKVTPFTLDLSKTQLEIHSYEESSRFGITPKNLLSQLLT